MKLIGRWILFVCLVTRLPGAEIRLGMVGLDTGHAVDFTELLNDPSAKNHVPGARVVAACKASSPDIESSWSRVDGHAKILQDKFGVTLYGTLEEMLLHVDAVLIEDNDARRHLQQAKTIILAGKPLYIEKPIAPSVADVQAIFALAREHRVPVFSSSGFRFARETQSVRHGRVGRVIRAEASSAAYREPTHPELLWYGIHGVETLFTVLGPEIEVVTRLSNDTGPIIVEGEWSGGRRGIFREGRAGGMAEGNTGVAPIGRWDGYAPLVAEIIRFFQTGMSPVPEKETVAIIAFIEADILSKSRGGRPVKIAEVMARAAASDARP